uniref:Coiled-coil domain containing 114 n=1 Tax=Sphaeramia orbicularis TaxID=375764 RepID=A0A673A1R6_9TELE
MPQRRSVTSGLSVNSKMDTDGSVESEMAKLQRQFKIMERDRQRYDIQAREQIHKEQQEIQKLLKEQEDIQQNLGACKSMSQQQKDDEETQRIHCLLEQWETAQEECETQKQSQKQLDKEPAGMQKRQISTKDTQRSEVRRTQKALRTLEHKLDRISCHLREDVQTLHKERTRFQQLHKRLDRKTGEVINVSIAAYDDRAKAQSKMIMIREKAVKDFADDNSKMKSLEIDFLFKSRLNAFMTTKCSERAGQYDGQEMGHRHELKEQRRVDSGEESLDALEEVFQRIQVLSGEDNLDMLVTRFIQVADRNFAVFNFVNEQNNEVETLRDQISQIQEKMEQLRVKELQQEQDHHSSLRNFDEQLNEALQEAEDYENQTKNIHKILDLIKTGLARLVNNISKIDCDRSVIENMLDTSTGISDNNIMSYLGLVEQNANELLTIQAFLNSKVTFEHMVLSSLTYYPTPRRGGNGYFFLVWFVSLFVS